MKTLITLFILLSFSCLANDSSYNTDFYYQAYTGYLSNNAKHDSESDIIVDVESRRDNFTNASFHTLVFYTPDNKGDYAFNQSITLPNVQSDGTSSDGFPLDLTVVDGTAYIINKNGLFSVDLSTANRQNTLHFQAFNGEVGTQVVWLTDSRFALYDGSHATTWNIEENGTLTSLAKFDIEIAGKLLVETSHNLVIAIDKQRELMDVDVFNFAPDSGVLTRVSSHHYEFLDEQGLDLAAIHVAKYDHNSSKLFLGFQHSDLFFSIQPDSEKLHLMSLHAQNGSSTFYSYPESDYFVAGDNFASIDWTNDRVVYDSHGLTVAGNFVMLSDQLIAIRGDNYLLSLSASGLTNPSKTIYSHLSAQFGEFEYKDKNELLFDEKSNKLVIYGRSERSVNGHDNDKQHLYIWDYHPSNNSLSFSRNVKLAPPDGFTSKQSLSFIGISNNLLYFLRTTTDNAHNPTLWQLDLSDNKAAKPVDSEFNSASKHIIDNVRINDEFFALLEFTREQFVVQVCQITEDSVPCQEQVLVDDYRFSDFEYSSLYEFYSLPDIQSFALVPSRSGISRNLNTAHLFHFNSSSKQFELTQSFDYDKNALYTTEQGNILFIGDTAYEYSSTEQTWQAIAEQPTKKLYTTGVTHFGDYFLTRVGQPYLYDSETRNFLLTGQSFQHSELYFLTSNGNGIHLDENSITTFHLSAPKVSILKNDQNAHVIQAVQDQPIDVDLAQFFVAGYTGNLEVIELPSQLSWDGDKISGSFSNEDIFASSNLNDPELARNYTAQFDVTSAPRKTTLFLAFELTNVDDIPVIQYVPGNSSHSLGDTVGLDIVDSIIDPDRTSISYEVSGLPPGLTLSNNTVLSGTLSTAGQYTITVTGTDEDNSSVQYSFAVTVQGQNTTSSNTDNTGSSTSKPSEGSSSGGGSVGFGMMLLLFLVGQRRRSPRL